MIIDDDRDFHDIAVMTEQHHGIPRVVFGVGMLERDTVVKVVVSQFEHYWDPYHKPLVMEYPDFNINRKQIPEWMTLGTVYKLQEWVKLNYYLLDAYQNDDTFDKSWRIIKRFIPVLEDVREEEDDYFHDLVIIDVGHHGINGDLWLGLGKISNNPPSTVIVCPKTERLDPERSIILQYPDFKITDSDVVKFKWLTTDVQERLNKWIQLNYIWLEQYNFDDADNFNSMNVTHLMNDVIVKLD